MTRGPETHASSQLSTPSELPIAVRAYAIPRNRKTAAQPKRAARRGRAHRWRQLVLIIDCETTIDETQRLQFGSYRVCRWTVSGGLECVEEGLFHADELPERDPDGYARLQEYAETRAASVVPGCSTLLSLTTRRAFVEQVFWKLAYRERALVVGFNLPFDLSRLAVECGEGRSRFRGSFSFVVWDYRDLKSGTSQPNRFRPRIGVRHLDSKRSFIWFTGPAKSKRRRRASRKARKTFRGNFLDLRTLAFALTNKSHTLASACQAFGVEHGKTTADEHGVITLAYVDYNRRDVLATQELLVKLRAEFDRHPIQLDPCRARSPASLAKAYLLAMGVTPPAVQFADVSPETLGYTMTAYYGGRAEDRIRWTPVPVIHTDFLSMYPSVDALLGLWELVTAERLKVVEATEEVRQLLRQAGPKRCSDPAFWAQLRFFALIEPEGDVLPVRAAYTDGSDALNIGVNPLFSETPLWFAGPDLVASILLTGRVPRVVRAFQLVPEGRQKGLRPVRLRGAILVDPCQQDFFRVVIEARQRLTRTVDGSTDEGARLDQFLKGLANSGSYGIFAELNPESLPVGQHAEVTVYGLDGPFEFQTSAPEHPGPFFFPPIAALITAAARLMLALLERWVRGAGGEFAFTDTDSMAIVATTSGGSIPCRAPNGRSTVHALSSAHVARIALRFIPLNPYDRQVVPGSILKIEKVNYDCDTRARLPLECLAISSKRYALFTREADGTVRIRDPKEHGLGHLLNPIDPTDPSRDWIGVLWEMLVVEAVGGVPVRPPWFDRPAVSREPITSPLRYRRFLESQKHLPYVGRIKPMNFVLSAQVAKAGQPAGFNPTRFHLIAPFCTDPRLWLRQMWTDIYTGERVGIATTMTQAYRIARVLSYGEVVAAYRAHPESKSAAPDGSPCSPETRGLLARRPVRATAVMYVGKEAHDRDAVEHGLVHDWDEVRTVYVDPRHDPWRVNVVPILKWIRRDELAEQAGLDPRTIQALRNERRRPSTTAREALLRAAVAFARRAIRNPSADPQLKRDAERLVRSPLVGTLPLAEASQVKRKRRWSAQ